MRTIVLLVLLATLQERVDPAKHWAFRPVAAPEVPEVRLRDWPRTAIDRFVLARLEEKGLRPAPPAGKTELLRRATFDLTGLPPAPGEIDAFLADDSPGAFEKVVDRLLASPHYGERWGRHWLDVVRYGESHGYERNHLRPNAWPYRDYVIRAFNEDRPFAEFVAEQLAGDVVGRDRPEIAVATGFLVAGVHDDVSSPEETLTRTQRANDLDDMVATTGAAFLGLTVGCARCHDHKFDPIPQADYYRMAAVFAGVRHDERPVASRTEVERLEREATEVSGKIRAAQGRIADLEERAREAVLRSRGVSPVPRPAVNAVRNVERFDPVRARFVRFVVTATKDGLEPCIDELEIYGPEGDRNLAIGAKPSASSVYPDSTIHRIEHLNDGRYGNDRSWISREKGGGWAQVELAEAASLARVVWSRDSIEKPKFRDRLASSYRVDVSEDGEAWRTVSTGADRAPADEKIPAEQLLDALAPAEREERAALAVQAVKLRERAAALKPATAYVGKFVEPHAVHVLSRGDVMKPGEAAPPGALSRIPGLSGALEARTEPERRLALARWIADPRNPLPARVLVNRAWQHHFGRGIVGTPSDFGTQGDPPTHPELLDWLAADFLANGGRLKRLHRLIMTSSAYRQSTRVDPTAVAVDAGNRLLWRMPLRRLESEALRDAILAASGALRRDPGGPGFALYKYSVNNIAFYEPVADPGPETWRRAVYAQAARAYREELMASFDAPENAQRNPRRDVTTTPLQALNLLNDRFVLKQAGLFADRVRREAGEGSAAQVARAFKIALGRAPGTEELRLAGDLVTRHGLAALARALFNANEFLHY
jgi:hypothetical protein